MFENLSDRLGGVFDRLTKQGALTEDDVTAAMREVRVALLEAIEATGSLARAADQLGVPYRTAWYKLKECVSRYTGVSAVSPAIS